MKFANDRDKENNGLRVGMFVSHNGVCASGHDASVRSVRDQEHQEFDDGDMMLQTTLR